MWSRQRSYQGKNVSDNSNQVDEDHRTEPCKHDSGKQSSLYDSGRTDSGFLSGANILSETCLSGEVTPPPERNVESPKLFSESKNYMRLDSGVDVGLSDQLSELCIEESCNSISGVKLSSSSDIKLSPSKENEESSRKQMARDISWEVCFQQDEEGDTQLHIAIIKNLVEAVCVLIANVPRPHYLDVFNDLRQTGLHLAVLTLQSDVVRKLVCAGARTDLVDRNGNTPLHLAIALGDLDCVKALTEPITDVEVASLGLKYTPSQRPAYPEEINMFNYEGLACVHLAVMNNIDNTRNAIVRHLYYLGANINAREWKSGRTPLHMAVEFGDQNLITMLLEQMGADVYVTTYAGHTPYHIARRNPNLIGTLIRIGLPEESDYSSNDEDDDEDADMQFQFAESAFRSFHTNGGIVNATA